MMDYYTRLTIINWIENNLVVCDNPRSQGKALTGETKNQRRYRVGDYRILCDLVDDQLIILVINVGHGREIYKK